MKNLQLFGKASTKLWPIINRNYVRQTMQHRFQEVTKGKQAEVKEIREELNCRNSTAKTVRGSTRGNQGAVKLCIGNKNSDEDKFKLVLKRHCNIQMTQQVKSAKGMLHWRWEGMRSIPPSVQYTFITLSDFSVLQTPKLGIPD